MRLRTFESFWLLKNGLLYSYPSLKKNVKTQVVVVGAGITGALISHSLMEQGFDVVMVDKRDVGQGSTSATTSMLQYEIDAPLHKLAEKIGEEGAARCYKAGIDAIRKLKKVVQNNNIDCGFKLKRSLYVAHNKAAAKQLYKEYLMRDRYRLGVEWLEPSQLKLQYGVLGAGAILSKMAASVDAYKLAHELIALNVKRGMQVYDQTCIKKIECKGAHPIITTVDGCKISTKKIVFCNGFESTLLLKEKVAKLVYTYACVSEQHVKLNNNLKDVLIWNTQDPYLYARTTDDNRILVGGCDEPYRPTASHQTIKEKKSVLLAAAIEKMIPGIQFIEDISWGGVFGTTKDSLPYIGASPEYKNSLFVLGFGGNGITFSTQGMELIPELLKGKDSDLSYYYRFGR